MRYIKLMVGRKEMCRLRSSTYTHDRMIKKAEEMQDLFDEFSVNTPRRCIDVVVVEEESVRT